MRWLSPVSTPLCSLGHNCYRSIPSLCGRGIPAVAAVPCTFLTPHHNVQYKHTHPVTPHTHTYTSHINIIHISIIHTHTHTHNTTITHIRITTHHTHTTVRYTHTKSHTHLHTKTPVTKASITHTPSLPSPPHPHPYTPLGEGCTSSTSHSCISLLPPSWLTSSSCSVASCL